MNELELKMDSLPAAAKKELRSFYEYLVFKYLKDINQKNQSNSDAEIETDKQLAAFLRFKKLRDQVNPVVDKSVDIDKLINEVNSDIF